MCDVCDQLNNIEIRTPGELFDIIDQLKEATKNGVFIEIPKKSDEDDFEQTKLFSIEKDKPLPDIIQIYLKCNKCGNEIELFCDTYHDFGGKIKIITLNNNSNIQNIQNNQNENLNTDQAQLINQQYAYKSAQTSVQPKKKILIRPLVLNTIIILGFFVMVFILPEDQIKDFAMGTVVISSLFVLFEGKRIEMQKYPTKFVRSSWAYAFFTFSFWIFAFPCFIDRRYKILSGELQKTQEPVSFSIGRLILFILAIIITLVPGILVINNNNIFNKAQIKAQQELIKNSFNKNFSFTIPEDWQKFENIPGYKDALLYLEKNNGRANISIFNTQNLLTEPNSTIIKKYNPKEVLKYIFNLVEKSMKPDPNLQNFRQDGEIKLIDLKGFSAAEGSFIIDILREDGIVERKIKRIVIFANNDLWSIVFSATNSQIFEEEKKDFDKFLEDLIIKKEENNY